MVPIKEFFVDIGQNSVYFIKCRDKKLIVVNPEVADRIADHVYCDGENGTVTANIVIAGSELDTARIVRESEPRKQGYSSYSFREKPLVAVVL